MFNVPRAHVCRLPIRVLYPKSAAVNTKQRDQVNAVFIFRAVWPLGNFDSDSVDVSWVLFKFRFSATFFQTSHIFRKKGKRKLNFPETENSERKTENFRENNFSQKWSSAGRIVQSKFFIMQYPLFSDYLISLWRI